MTDACIGGWNYTGDYTTHVVAGGVGGSPREGYPTVQTVQSALETVESDPQLELVRTPNTQGTTGFLKSKVGILTISELGSLAEVILMLRYDCSWKSHNRSWMPLS